MAFFTYLPRRRAAAVGVLSLVAFGLSGANLVGGSQTGRASAAGVDPASVASIVSGLDKVGAGPRFETTVFGYQEDTLPVPNVDAVVSFGDEKPDPVGPYPTPQTVVWQNHAAHATVGQIGAVYGIAHSEGNPDATSAAAKAPRSFYGAYLKSQTRFGPSGPGGIYVRSGNAVTPYVTIPNAGGDASPLGGLHAATGTDITTKVGKASLGDLEIDAEEHFLYVTNLSDGRVYQVDTWTNTVVGALAKSPNNCADVADQHPFGLKVKGSTVYLGTVCSAETSKDPAKLGADVWAYNTATTTWAATPVMHAIPVNGSFGGFTPWSDDISNDVVANRGAMLTGIDIDPSGSMVLGLRNRVGDIGTTSATYKQIDGSGAVSITPPNGAGGWKSFIEVDPNVANVNAAPVAPLVAPRTFETGSSALGAVVSVPFTHAGQPGSEIAATQRDVFSWSAQGVLWFDVANPGPLTIAAGEEANRVSNFAKASGLGDLEMLATWRAFGDRVWLDANGDGLQTSGENGVAGVKLNLKSTCTSATLASVTTDAQGHYSFYVKPFEAYTVVADATNFAAGGALLNDTYTQQVAGDGTNNSKVDIGTGCVTVAKASREDVNVTYDIGVKPLPKVTYAVGDRVWVDANGNGAFDDTEKGLKDVCVQAFVGGTPASAKVLTDAEGYYVIGGLSAGDYTLAFTCLPDGYTFTTTTAAGVADDRNSDASGTGVTRVVTLDATAPAATAADRAVLGAFVGDKIIRTIDAGLKAPVEPRFAVGDKVWLDANHNGRQDIGESPVGNVSVTLLASGSTTPLSVTTTNPDGFYIFDNLAKGSYTAKFATPAGYRLTTPNAAGVATDVNSDAIADGTTATFVLDAPSNPQALNMTTQVPLGYVANYINATIDAGLYVPLAIGDVVWSDANGDGIQNAGEPGVPGVKVTLTSNGAAANDATGAPVGPVVTAADGSYHFDNLLPGTYVVTFADTPAGLSFVVPKANGSNPSNDSDVDPATASTSVVLPATGGALVLTTPADGALTATFIDKTVDAGLFAPAYSIGNRVWFDENDNGIVDAGEYGIAAVTVRLYTAAADGGTGDFIAGQDTDTNGFYRFTGLAAGNYVVRVEAVNFADGGHLVGFLSSFIDETNPNDDKDLNDNGVGELGGPNPVTSGVITLGPGASEPTGELDLGPGGQGASDAQANMTVDFGFTVVVDLGITKTLVSKELGKGSTITWKIAVDNNGSVAVDGAKVVDLLPITVKPGKASGAGWSCAFAGQELTCVHDGSIAAGAESSFEVEGEVLISNGSIVNSATVSNPRGPDVFTANDADQVSATVATKVLVNALPRTGSGLWKKAAVIADLLATLGAVLVIHDMATRRRRALGCFSR
jgi:SdrD B-like domain/Domain of unknown function DUF11